MRVFTLDLVCDSVVKMEDGKWKVLWSGEGKTGGTWVIMDADVGPVLHIGKVYKVAGNTNSFRSRDSVSHVDS